MIVSVLREPETLSLLRRETDSRGRVTIGKRFADSRVELALDVEDVLPTGAGVLVRVDHDAIRELDVDSRGRVNLGTSRANESLKVVVFTAER